MAVTLLLVLVLGVFAAATDVVPVTWWSTQRASLQCVVPDADKIPTRRPPPPLSADDELEPIERIYIWKKGNEEIKKGVSANGVLEIPRNKDGSTEGVYQCSVPFYNGFVLGYPINLRFAYIDKISAHPENATAWLGQPYALSCVVDSGPPASITWLKNEEPLPANSSYHILKNHLLILNVSEEDTGVYRCKVTNTHLNKSLTSHPGKLQVDVLKKDLYPSLIPINEDTHLKVSKGSKVVLACPVLALPRPKFTWRLTPPGERTSELEDSDEVLVLSNIQPDQEGVYVCSVDEYSHINKTFNVTVMEPVAIVLPPVSRDSFRASTVRFNCTATGRPEPDVVWYKDGKLLALVGRIVVLPSVDLSRLELLIRSVTSQDAGVYQCFASNEVSSVSGWGRLTVTGAEAAAPEGLTCRPVGPHAVSLHWDKMLFDIVAYTVLITDPRGTSLPSQPVLRPETVINLDEALIPYTFHVRAYIRAAVTNKTIASDLSPSVICQGQGVPIQLSQLSEDSILVSWKRFSDRNPNVSEWMIQYKYENSTDVYNVTLPSEVNSYILDDAEGGVHVRVLGSVVRPWVALDLGAVPWTSSIAVKHRLEDGEEIPVPEELEAVEVSSRQFTVRWRSDEVENSPDPYVFVVCTRRIDTNEKCSESDTSALTVKNLQPDSEYEVRVQVQLSDRILSGEFSQSIRITTPPEAKDLQHEITESGVRVRWRGHGPRLVRYSQNLTQALDDWPTINVTGAKTVTITGIDLKKVTYVMVAPPGANQRSQVITILPKPESMGKASTYIILSILFGVILLCLMALTAGCIWKRRKHTQSPLRSRRRNFSPSQSIEEQCSEMKHIGGRLANGGGSKDAGEPLLNGHVHITENPNVKTPNGRMRKGRGHKTDPTLDLSRLYEEQAPTAPALDLLDFSRPADFEEPSFPGGALKLPDDNMNCQVRSVGEGGGPGALHPNG